MPPTCCPPTAPRRGAPFAQQGPRRTGSPAPNATMRRSDSLRPSPLASYCFARRYRPVRLSSSLRSGPTPACGQELWVLAAPRQSVSRRSRSGSPKVPRQPSWALAVFFDPGRTGHPSPWRGADVAPVVSKTKAPAGSALEAQSHGFGPDCLRFVGKVAPPRRKTRFRWLARPCRLGLVTHRVAAKGFKDTASYPPLPSFPGARTVHGCPRLINRCGIIQHQTAEQCDNLDRSQQEFA